ncbi:KIF1-binding protein [Biomphalaria glabrata]|uniref:KIF-binding protein n=1 Tax=Biomphalaria glabrata TaxID=6526 RepID=A0A2C9JEQ9_BIOGL|nr:KIF1-binding protein-like [Biomphalaria glabrata]KAI8785085.1 KIF1-binding protein [Biomphalaria glabrata]
MAALGRLLGDDVIELYKNAKFLSDDESKNDPEDEPFRSKYKAREIYKDICNKIKDKLNGSSVANKTLLTSLICLEQAIGLNYMDTEELAEGEDCLMSCLKRIEEYGLKDAVSLHMNILNYLGILWSERRDLEKSLGFLQQAENLYSNYKKEIGDAPLAYIEFLEDFEGDDNEKAHQRCQSFENIHTHTLYYLAQVYAKLEKNSLSARYCHLTLQRQLQAGDYNPVDWGLNAATLSQYYLTAEKYTEARHCLASGSFIFQSSKKSADQLSEQDLEAQCQREADIERCWIKYGLGLLEASRDKMLGELEDNDNENTEGPSSVISRSDHNADKQVADDIMSESSSDKVFQEFQLELTAYEERITDKLIRTFDEARKIFLFVVDKIKNAQMFYNLESHASDAVQIIQDHSRAFKLLAFFELDMNRQCRMHKRRIDMLSELLRELNPQHYLLVCRQIIYELAETYSEMVDLKVTLIEMERTRATPYSTNKINKLVQQSIDQYQAYIDSLKGGKSELPSEFPEGDVRPALVAFFCMGRLYSKFLEPLVPERLAKLTKSLECYKFVTNYCEANPSAKELIPNELGLCKEMVSLLPVKMAKLLEQQ